MPSTRSKNATQRPGIVDKGAPRRTSKEVAAARQAKEDAKQEKARTKAAGIQRVAEYEKAQADEDALDATPQVVTKPKLKPLTRTRSYADVLADVVPDSDVDMSDGGLTSSFRPDRIGDSETAESNAETDIVTSLPRKKKKVVRGEAKIVESEVKVKKEKAPKPRVRDAIKAVQVANGEKVGPAKLKAFARITTNDDVLDLDPTPKPMKRQALAIELDNDKMDIEPPLWRMPALSEGSDVESIPEARGEEMMKGKGKAKADPKHRDRTIGTDQKPSDTKRVPPKLKRHVYSLFRLFLLSCLMLTLDATTLYYYFLSEATNGKKSFSSGINDWAASIPSNAKPASRATTISKPGSRARPPNSTVPPLTNASTWSSSNSVLTKDIMITKKAAPPAKITIVDGGLSDEDETTGFEREAAVTSPPKGKQRVTSANIVKVVSPAKPLARPKRKLGNNDLPDGIDMKLWRRAFVATYMQFVGGLTDPWDIPPRLACEKMQLIWDALFDIEYEITPTSTVYIITLQRIADSYRSTTGSSGIAITVAYCESQEDLKDSDENRVEFAKYALDKLRFCYKRADGDDKKKFRGLYQGAFVVQTLAAHYTAIDGARKITGMESAIAKPIGAIALSCAAVERALTLIATGTLTIEMISAAKGKNVPLPKTLNVSTGKISTRQTGFNDATWGDSTRAFVRSISKAFARKEHKFAEIIASAKEFSKKSRRPDNSADGTPAGGEEDEELDERALLEDISSSESGSEAGSVEV